MNNHSESGTKPENPAIQQWGLKRDITPYLAHVWFRRANVCTIWLTEQDLAGRSPTMLQCALTRHFRS
ncbi:hypothetical protein ENINMA044M2_14265 [Enterobacter intestinihominis]